MFLKLLIYTIYFLHGISPFRGMHASERRTNPRERQEQKTKTRDRAQSTKERAKKEDVHFVGGSETSGKCYEPRSSAMSPCRASPPSAGIKKKIHTLRYAHAHTHTPRSRSLSLSLCLCLCLSLSVRSHLSLSLSLSLSL